MLSLIHNYLRGRLLLLSIITGFLILTYLLPVIFPSFINPYLGEDGLIENLGALSFLIASITLFITFLRTLKNTSAGHKKWEGVWIVGLSLFFFVACGEEISWGQRIFNFDTPEALMETNQQHEFNLHNLAPFHGIDDKGERKTGLAAWLTMHRLFYLILIGYLIVVPFVMLFENWLSKFLDNMGIPITPIWIGVIFLLVIFLAKVTQYLFARNDFYLYHILVEIMETNIAFITLLLSMAFYKDPKGERNLKAGFAKG